MNLRAAYFAVIGPAMVKRAFENPYDEDNLVEQGKVGLNNELRDEFKKIDEHTNDVTMKNDMRNDVRRSILGEDTGLGNYGRVGSKGPSAEDAQALKGGPGFFSNLGSALKGAIMEDIPDAVLSGGRAAGNALSSGYNAMKDGLSEAYKGMQVPGQDRAALENLDMMQDVGNDLRKIESEQKKKTFKREADKQQSSWGKDMPKTGQAKVWAVMQGWKAGQITTDQIKQLPAHDLQKVANVVYNEARLGDQQAGLLWQLLNG